MRKWVVGVAAGISAGKSTYVAALAAATGAQRTAFGEFVRKLAAERGLDFNSREVLQELGESLKADLGPEEFVRRVLAETTPDAPLVVDGVRHTDIADALAVAVAPRTFFLVFLDADEATRQERAAIRAERDRLRELDQHSTETQVHDGSLRERAHLVLDARRDVTGLVVETIEHLSRATLSKGIG